MRLPDLHVREPYIAHVRQAAAAHSHLNTHEIPFAYLINCRSFLPLPTRVAQAYESKPWSWLTSKVCSLLQDPDHSGPGEASGGGAPALRQDG